MKPKTKVFGAVLLCCALVLAFTACAGCTDSIEKIFSKQSSESSSDAKIAKSVSQAIEPSSSVVRSLALNAIKSSSSGSYNMDQICDIYDYLYKHWTYVSDPNTNSDYYAKASESARLMKGDCDDFAILMASCIEAIGGTARVVIAENAYGEGHAYAEVYFANTESEQKRKATSLANRYSDTIHAHPDGDSGYWLNLDWSATHPGGKFFASKGDILIIYSSGNYQRQGFTVQNGWS